MRKPDVNYGGKELKDDKEEILSKYNTLLSMFITN
jgi:hypothetical protein